MKNKKIRGCEKSIAFSQPLVSMVTKKSVPGERGVWGVAGCRWHPFSNDRSGAERRRASQL